MIKIHDLVILAKKMKLQQDLIAACERVNPVYVEARYPDAAGFKRYFKDDAISDIKGADRVLKWLKKNI